MLRILEKQRPWLLKSLSGRSTRLLQRHSFKPWTPTTPIPKCRHLTTAEAHPNPPSLPLQPPGLQLRPYQEECIESILTAINDGRRQIGVSLATGSGKTVIFTELIGRIPAPSEHATQTLILVHRRELVEQAARHCTSRYPDKTVEIEMASLRASGHADVTVASIQSINSRGRIKKFDPSRFKLVLVDEAHHIVASGYLRVLEHLGFQSENTVATPALVGVSATMSRFDGLALGKAIKHIVYHKDYVDMIGEKWLSDVIFTTVQSTADTSKVKKGANGDFLTSELSEVVRGSDVNLVTFRAWQARAAHRKSTIVFCVDLKHVDSLTNAFRMRGVDARFVTGDTKSEVRSARLDAFKNREFPVLVNCGVFTEGTDIPNIDCVILARPTKSRNLLVQMIGRGMRLYPGKTDCHIIDMVASLESGIVTTPTLFGLDPGEVISEATPQDMQTAKTVREKLRQEEPKADVAQGATATSLMQRDTRGKITYTDYDSVNDLVDDTSSERYIRAISQNTWVHVGEDRYILANGPSGSYLTIEKGNANNLFTVKVTTRLPSTAAAPRGAPIFAKPRVVATSETFEAAVHGADSYAAKRFTRVFIARHPPGNWRERPASEAQVAFLNKFRAAGEQLTTQDITKGKAGDMITKIKFGARGRIKRVVDAKKRTAKARLKREEWERKEVVEVGPVDA